MFDWGSLAAWGVVVLGIVAQMLLERRHNSNRIAEIEKECRDKIATIEHAAVIRDEAREAQHKLSRAEIYDKMDSFRDNYVRRDDLASDMARLETGQSKIAEALTYLTREVHHTAVQLAAISGAVPGKDQT